MTTPASRRSTAHDPSRDPLLGHGVVTAADYMGTAVFAAQGALAGSAAGFDLFGVLIVAFVTALGGGIVRDVLIGATPAAALADWRYPAIAFLTAAAVVAVRAAGVRAWPDGAIFVLDAAGLSLFAVAGARKAQRFGLHPIVIVMMGGVTGSGGGVLRDVLLNTTPRILLPTDIYATAALAGAALMLLAQRAGLAIVPAAVAGGLACFTIRLGAVAAGWRLPAVG